MSLAKALYYPGCYYSDEFDCFERFPDLDEDIFIKICCRACKTYLSSDYVRPLIRDMLVNSADSFLERILPNITVIAVGCGRGATEQALFGLGYPIIGVDPDPVSYHKINDANLGPQFVTIVASYLSELHLPKSPKLLSLIWPGPIDVEYDIEALLFAEWDQILLYYDKNGDIEYNSGSKKFHRFLNKQTTYKCIFSVVTNIADINLFTLELYQRNTILPLPELFDQETEL